MNETKWENEEFGIKIAWQKKGDYCFDARDSPGIATITPKIHQQLWEKWGLNLPSDAQLKHTLLLEWPTPFNENAVDGFIAEYKDTVSFAKLSPSDRLASEVQKNGGTDEGLLVGEKTPKEKPPILPPQKQNMRQDVFSLAEGTVTIEWPTQLSAESIQDVKEWLKIVERKITRSVATSEEPPQKNSAKVGAE